MVRERLAVYRNKKVFVTGHTGFKGSWLVAMLKELGCEIYGYALEPPAGPNHYELVGNGVNSCTGDIRDLSKLTDELSRSGAEILFHLAAQSLVRASYQDPLYTCEVNVMGSLHVLEAVRRCSHVKAVVMVTTDKVYANRETHYAYKETDRLGGHDLYSRSKACFELLND